MSEHPVFHGLRSDMFASEDLVGTITGFYDETEGRVVAQLVEHAGAFLVSEVRIGEYSGARFGIDVSRTTATAVMLVVERLAGVETGDLVFAGTRVGVVE
jgi:hypothetical protein